jgi:hypothetical protein
MKKFSLLLLSITLLWATTKVSAQAPVPELLHYVFNGSGTTVPNLASNPPAGTANATLMGGLTQGGVGQCGGGVIGTGVASTTDYVNTGWATSLPGSFTISFWTSNISGTSTLYYIFGDLSAGSFRCFTNGVAGANNWILRGTGITDVYVNGAATVAPSLTTFVYDQSANTIKGYFNGILTTTVAQAATPTISGTGPFKVVGYSSNVGSSANSILDEFRVYSRALSDAEVLSLYTVTDYDTIAVSACTSYTSPSGLYTYTASGSYNDTLTNSSGCDSILTIDLTISAPTTASITEVVCNTYTSPSGNYTWTTSGTYNDTIPNSIGCDSIITINLTINNSSTSSVTASACDSYTSPSGNHVWTASGTYNDTLVNSVGCDSIITFNLTINLSTNSNISVTACDSYTSPSGLYTWTASGAYSDTIANSAGCDSIIFITLTVNSSNTSSITETACDSYTSPSGNVWTIAGTYFDTIPNEAGCDSIITINLILNTSTASTINPVACNTYTSPAGNVLTASGTYTETIPNNAGCDSVITINLTIATPTASSISASSCGSYTTPSGNVVTTAGTFNDTIANSNGCDSVITITLTINTPTASAINATACGSYTTPSGNVVTTSGTFNDTIANSNGCDSVITITLVINNANTAATQAGPVLTATAVGATYQWINCPANTPINGATSQVYTATANGSYAVIVTENGCTDTSACLTVTGISIAEVGSLAGNLNMFPNPTSGVVTISSTVELYNAVVRVYSHTGQLVIEQNIADGKIFTFSASDLAAGIYVVDVTSGSNFARMKLVKN